jgi:hypothetical protein
LVFKRNLFKFHAFLYCPKSWYLNFRFIAVGSENMVNMISVSLIIEHCFVAYCMVLSGEYLIHC